MCVCVRETYSTYLGPRRVCHVQSGGRSLQFEEKASVFARNRNVSAVIIRVLIKVPLYSSKKRTRQRKGERERERERIFLSCACMRTRVYECRRLRVTKRRENNKERKVPTSGEQYFFLLFTITAIGPRIFHAFTGKLKMKYI